MSLPQSLLMVSAVMTITLTLAPPAFADQGNSKHQDATEFDVEGTDPDSPLPPGIKERVFIHLPRSPKPGHLGTCTVTTSDTVTDYGLTGWHLPASGITWQLNTATVPSSVSSTAVTALINAFNSWTAADSKKKFFYGGATSVKRSRLDFVNAVLWGRISAGAIAITYVRYYTSTGQVADVDMVFNLRYPWASFNPSLGECQSSPDAYDVQNIATHEIGHWIGLDDLYLLIDKDLTLYGYGAGGELKKQTLGAGDIAGVNAVAP